MGLSQRRLGAGRVRLGTPPRVRKGTHGSWRSGELAESGIDHRKSTLARGSRKELYTPTILGGNSYLSWFYDRGAIKDQVHTGTSEGLSQAMNRGPITKFLPKYANVNVTIQSHGLSAGARTHYVPANRVRNGLNLGLSLWAGNKGLASRDQSGP